MQVITQFNGGLNASAAPNNIAENEVAAASNIDFSLQEGALVSRRGSRVFKSGFTGSVHTIYRNYNNPYDYGNSPWYFAGTGAVYRHRGTSSETLLTNTGNITAAGFNSFDEFTLIAYGGTYLKDNGTVAVDWIMQAPSTSGSITLTTQASPLAVAGTWSAIEGVYSEGTGTDTLPNGTATLAGADGGRIVVELNTLTTTNLNTNGGFAINDYGVHYIDIAFDTPELVTKISCDYSIGDALFNNYYHTEYSIGDITDAAPTGDDLVDAYQSTTNTTPVDIATRERMLNELRLNLRVPKMVLPKAADTFSVWAVPRSSFGVVGKNTTVGWTNIQAARIIIEYSETVTAYVRNWTVNGSSEYALNDPDNGYVWWETFATLDTSSNIVNESAPSPMTARFPCQHVKAVIVSTSTATGTSHGITHRLFYRQGGYLRDAYLVGSNTYAATSTFTDTLGDIPALLKGQRLIRNIYSKSTIPGSIQYISEPHFNRVFVGERNNIMWSEPNKPGTFKLTNYSRVAQRGDEIQGIVSWMPVLCIVNRDSVYELSGSVFDGQQADWSLYRTGATRGSKAQRTVIKTPYGIPLLDYDGLHMYVPGQGIEQKLEWVDSKIGDAWTGTSTYDPSYLATSRVPAINKGYINSSFAVWANTKLYLGVPTGSSAVPNTLFVLDFATKRVWYYSYPFSMASGRWDPDDNQIYVGTTDGVVMRIEAYNNDSTTGGTETPIAWSVRTRTWTWPNEVRLTNLSIENDQPTRVEVVRNSTSTETVVTRTNTVRDRYMPTMSGSLANNAYFNIVGTQSSSSSRCGVYELNWDAYPEPAKELYHRTQYFSPETEQEFMALNSELDCLGGTVTGTMKVDGSPVGTFTFTGTVGPQGYTKSFSSRVFGRVAYVEYYSTTPFRHYNTHYTSSPEPPRLTFYRTDYAVFDGEQEWKAIAAQLDCLNGTVLCTAFVDNTAISTSTFTGTGPQGYVRALPATSTAPLPHPFGRSGYAIFTGTSVFKHYKSWFETLPEPSLVLHFRTPTKIFPEEQEIRNAKCELNCYAGTVTGIVHVDGTAVSTATFTGSGYIGHVVALPEKTYGRSAYVVYSGSANFKHYMTEYDATPEPPRVRLMRSQTFSWPSEQQLKTLVVTVNPLGSPVTAVIRSKDVAIATTTFTGSTRETFNYGLDVAGTALTRLAATDAVDVYYSSTSTFKHYDTNLEVEPAPFDKLTWQVTYRKIGGATQLDTPRFYSLDAEVLPYVTTTTSTVTATGTSTGTFTTVTTNTATTATVTSIWEVDNISQATYTMTITNRQFVDRVSLPSGMRGHLFSQRLLSNIPIKIWKSNLDIIRTGIKGLSRTTITGVVN